MSMNNSPPESRRQISTPNQIFGWVVEAMNAAGSLLILLIALIICIDVAYRNIVGEAIPGVTEVLSFSVVMIVFLQATSALRSGKFVRADMLITPLISWKPRIGYSLLMIFNLLGAVVMLIIFYGSLPLMMKAWNQGLFFGIPGVFTAPEWPIRVAVVTGSFMLAIQFLIDAYREFKLACSRGNES
jgi:TRAP-type C4-dicarboxylate transport system permease small subunit